MSEVSDHKRLEVWRASMDLSTRIYEVSADFPDTERYGLIAQVRRAAVSVPSNIAEGMARGLGRGCLYHLGVAAGSLAEVETQLEIALRLKFLEVQIADDVQARLISARRLLFGLRRAKRIRLGLSASGVLILLLSVFGIVV